MHSYPSETAKYRHLTAHYCEGCGLDIGSQGDPVVPWAWQLELPTPEYAHYNANHKLPAPVQLRGHMHALPVESDSLSWVYCSHVIEDTLLDKWPALMREWARVVRVGGYVIVLAPERERWNYAIRVLGQCPNCSHRHEPILGDLSQAARVAGLDVVEERLTACFEHDYSLLLIARRIA